MVAAWVFPLELKSLSVKLELLQACLRTPVIHALTRCTMQFVAELRSQRLSARQSLRLHLSTSIRKKVQIWEEDERVLHECKSVAL